MSTLPGLASPILALHSAVAQVPGLLVQRLSDQLHDKNGHLLTVHPVKGLGGLVPVPEPVTLVPGVDMEHQEAEDNVGHGSLVPRTARPIQGLPLINSER